MSRENAELVRRIYDVFNNLDTESIGEVWSAECEFRPALTGGGVIEGAVYRGHEGIAEFIAVQAETWERVTAEPVTIRDLEESVLVEVRLDAVGRASGAALQRTTWHGFDIRAGKLASGRVYTSRDEALEAVGLRE